jgi:hypothetical protein
MLLALGNVRCRVCWEEARYAIRSKRPSYDYYFFFQTAIGDEEATGAVPAFMHQTGLLGFKHHLE